ncbi:hypothetical protein [Amycolatopsis sp. NPDC098790]|uniref:hypothetical protein n=1 Tax=Amycolatopsis sp. NPDC098790 TaxID=3363939 RepID=UPI00380E7E8A
MDTSQYEDTSDRSVLARVVLMAGALVGFGFLAVLLSGTANAAERSPEPPGLLSEVGKPLKGIDPALQPVTDVVHSTTSRLAPAVDPVAAAAGPLLAPVVRPVAEVVAPVLSVVRPVTEPVLKPVLHAVAPVTEPVVRAVGAEPVVKAVGGDAVAPRDDVRPAPAGPGNRPEVVAPAVRAQPQRVAAVAVAVHHAGSQAGRTADEWTSGSDSGGSTPHAPPMPDVPGTGGSMSTGTSGQHGGEFAVTVSRSVMPGVDRTWQAPPGGPQSLYWTVFFGNDHPS